MIGSNLGGLNDLSQLRIFIWNIDDMEAREKDSEHVCYYPGAVSWAAHFDTIQ